MHYLYIYIKDYEDAKELLLILAQNNYLVTMKHDTRHNKYIIKARSDGE